MNSRVPKVLASIHAFSLEFGPLLFAGQRRPRLFRQCLDGSQRITFCLRNYEFCRLIDD